MRAKMVLWASFFFGAMALMGFLQAGAAAQSQPPPMTVEPVSEGIYLVKGGAGANCGFVVGEKEVLVIDAKMTVEATQKMLEEIKKITAKPLSCLALTHSDGDHVNGITGFPEGMVVVSQQGTRDLMDKAFTDPAQRKFLPLITIDKDSRIFLAPHDIRLLHFGPAHTNGDMVLFFPGPKLAFVGDLLFIGRDPLIHLQKSGSSAGLIQTWKEILKLDVDLFLPGHGNPAGRKEAEEFLRGIEEKREKVAALAKAGKTLDEIKREFGIEEKPAPEGARRWPTFVEIVYQELSAKK